MALMIEKLGNKITSYMYMYFPTSVSVGFLDLRSLGSKKTSSSKCWKGLSSMSEFPVGERIFLFLFLWVRALSQVFFPWLGGSLVSRRILRRSLLAKFISEVGRYRFFFIVLSKYKQFLFLL